MDCYYTIKLPNGGEIQVPANLSTIEGSVSLNQLFDEYKILDTSGTEEESDKIVELRDKIREKITTGLHHSTINSVLNRAKTFKEFVELINGEVADKLHAGSIEDALFAFLKDKEFYKKGKYTPVIFKDDNGKEVKLTLDQFYQRVTKPISKKYFRNIKVETLLGAKTGAQMLDSIQGDIGKNLALQQSTGLLKSLNDVIYRVFSPAELKSKIFYNTSFRDDVNTSVVLEDESTGNPIVFYNDSNELSMFLGVFGYAAAKLSPEDVLEVIELYNEKSSDVAKINTEKLDVKKFFLGELTDTGFIEPEFNKLYSVKYGKNALNKLVTKVVDTLEFKGNSAAAERGKLAQGMREIFGKIAPDKYGESMFGAEFTEKIAIEAEYNEHIEAKISQLKKFYKDKFSNTYVNFYYSAPQDVDTSTVESLQESILNNVELYKDVIQYKFDRIIPTSIVKKRNGLIIQGFKKTDGDPEDIGMRGQAIVIKKGDHVTYRKFTDANPIEIDMQIASDRAVPLRTLYPNKPIIDIDPTKVYGKNTSKRMNVEVPHDFIKAFIRRGSKINYKYWSKKEQKTKEAWSTVRFSAPGIIRVEGFGDNDYFDILYSNVLSFEAFLDDVGHDFVDKDWKDKKAVMEPLLSVERTQGKSLPVRKGDIIKAMYNGIPRYNEVVGVTDKYAFVIMKTLMQKGDGKEEIHKIIAINKQNIDTLYTKRVNDFELSEGKAIAKEYMDVFVNEQSVRSYKRPVKYSYFTNYETAMNGDFVLIPIDKERGGVYKIIDKENRYVVGLNVSSQNPYKTLSDADLEKATTFITERDISSMDSLYVANINNFFLLTADAINDPKIRNSRRFQHLFKNGYVLTPVRYLVPKRISTDIVAMSSGNLNVGTLRFGAQLDEEIADHVDITEDRVAWLNKHRNFSGSQLFMFQKNTNGYIKRYNQSLQEYILQDENGQIDDANYPEKYIENLATNVYLGYQQGWGTEKSKFSNKMYKIVVIDGDTMILEYAGTTNDGKTITIRRKESIEKAFEQKKFKVMYVNKTSDINTRLYMSLEKEYEYSDKKTRRDLIHRVSNKLGRIFKIYTRTVDIDTDLDENAKYRGKKAWLQQTGDSTAVPEVIFNLRNEKSTERDTLHEYLHLMLIALRYSTNQELYEQIIQTYKKKKGLSSDNPFDIEESLVNTISRQLMNSGFIDEDENFKELLYTGIREALNKYSEGTPVPIYGNIKLEDILHTKMEDIFSNVPNTETEMKTANTVFFDMSFRGWVADQMDLNELKIDC